MPSPTTAAPTTSSPSPASAANAANSVDETAAGRKTHPSSLLFDYYVILDFEATCDNPTRLAKPEIIEFPLVVVDARSTSIINEFQRYVRPVINPVLTPFCKELTGIQQPQVDAAETFPAVYKEAIAWLEANQIGFDAKKGQKSFAIVTCGDWDLKTMLPVQLGHSDGALAKSQYFSRWINLKIVMQRLVGNARRIGGMEAMLDHYGLPLEGRHHSGIDDCRNIAAVLIQMLRGGVSVDYTSKSPMFDPRELPPLRYADRKVRELTHTLAPRTLASVVPSSSSASASAAAGGSSSVQKTAKTSSGGGSSSAVVDANGFLVIRDDSDPIEAIALKYGGGRTMAPKEQMAFSKRLAAVLRHNALKMGFAITRNGFIAVDELLSHPNFKNLDIATLALIVRENEKQRYRMVYGQDGLMYICANQGHSMPHVVPDLKEIKNAQEAPAVCVHGTYYEPWKIIAADGLRPMKRQFVHFAKGLPGDANVISGMRTNAQILVYVDVPAMIADGLHVFESVNGVLLCSGNNDRVILPKYFSKVIDTKTGKDLTKP